MSCECDMTRIVEMSIWYSAYDTYKRERSNCFGGSLTAGVLYWRPGCPFQVAIQWSLIQPSD